MLCLGDSAVLFRRAGVLELTDSHKQRFPVHQSEADVGLRPRHLCEILHPRPTQVHKNVDVWLCPVSCTFSKIQEKPHSVIGAFA